MPTLTADDINVISSKILCSLGAAENDAEVVANHLADANMVGHDSHGFIRILQYVSDIRQGWLDPKAHPEIVAETKGLAQVDGHNAFGQVAATFSTRLAMDKAREHGISLVTMCNVAHAGRLGAYPEMAANEGMAAIMFLGIVGGRIARVAPFGGLKVISGGPRGLDKGNLVACRQCDRRPTGADLSKENLDRWVALEAVNGPLPSCARRPSVHSRHSKVLKLAL